MAALQALMAHWTEQMQVSDQRQADLHGTDLGWYYQGVRDTWRLARMDLSALIAESPRLLDQKKQETHEEVGARSSPSTQTEPGDIASAMKGDPPSARNDEP